MLFFHSKTLVISAAVHPAWLFKPRHTVIFSAKEIYLVAFGLRPAVHFRTEKSFILKRRTPRSCSYLFCTKPLGAPTFAANAACRAWGDSLEQLVLPGAADFGGEPLRQLVQAARVLQLDLRFATEELLQVLQQLDAGLRLLLQALELLHQLVADLWALEEQKRGGYYGSHDWLQCSHSRYRTRMSAGVRRYEKACVKNSQLCDVMKGTDVSWACSALWNALILSTSKQNSTAFWRSLINLSFLHTHTQYIEMDNYASWLIHGSFGWKQRKLVE